MSIRSFFGADPYQPPQPTGMGPLDDVHQDIGTHHIVTPHPQQSYHHPVMDRFFAGSNGAQYSGANNNNNSYDDDFDDTASDAGSIRTTITSITTSTQKGRPHRMQWRSPSRQSSHTPAANVDSNNYSSGHIAQNFHHHHGGSSSTKKSYFSSKTTLASPIPFEPVDDDMILGESASSSSVYGYSDFPNESSIEFPKVGGWNSRHQNFTSYSSNTSQGSPSGVYLENYIRPAASDVGISPPFLSFATRTMNM
jgi:hypothetical protein